MMEDIIYNAITNYFTTLRYTGYVKKDDVDKLLLLIFLYEFTYWDFRGYISKEDYSSINNALYKIFGKSCLVPYPNFCKIKDMNKLHIGDISELAYRVKHNEQNIAEMQSTPVIKNLENVEIIEDI